jgi:uncharacterized membrane protein YfcA
VHLDTTLVLFAAVVALAFTVEAALGFGSTILAVALGAALLPIDALLAAFVPVNVALSAAMVVRHRKHVDVRLLATRVVPVMAVGLPIGLLALARLDPAPLRAAFGAFVIVLAAVELVRLARPGRDARSLPRAAKVALLALGGVVHGAFGTGGPMAVYVASRVVTDKARMRATLAALWLVLNTVLVATYAVTGAIGAESLARSAWLVPALGLGLLLGEALHARVPERAFRIAVYTLLLGAGAFLAGST